MDWVALFCDVDDFCLGFEPQFRRRLLSGRTRSRDRDGRLSLSEMMTIVIAFQLSHYRDFKAFYNNLRESGSDLFPGLVSYQLSAVQRPDASADRSVGWLSEESVWNVQRDLVCGLDSSGRLRQQAD
jgi:hypothetical protein